MFFSGVVEFVLGAVLFALLFLVSWFFVYFMFGLTLGFWWSVVIAAAVAGLAVWVLSRAMDEISGGLADEVRRHRPPRESESDKD